jgi:hypothetical protein
MNLHRTWILFFAASTLPLECHALGSGPAVQNEVQSPAPGNQAATQIVRKIGTVVSIAGNAITLKTDSGETANVVVEEGARIVRIAPGERDLKNAVPIQLAEVQVSDRILVAGKMGGDNSLRGASLVLIKQADVAQKQMRETQEWQKHGVGGIVKSIDAANGAITLAITPSYNVVVKTSKETEFLRYANNSVRFSDAKPSTFAEIASGEQLRAHGTKGADGKEFEAKQVISGAFRNIAGVVEKVDPSNSTLVVKDVLSKKTVVVQVTPDSRMQKLTVVTAQRIASLLKNPAASPPASSSGSSSAPPDVQQIISKAPAITMGELQKDGAVILVATPGDGKTGVTAVTLLSGAEPILTSSASGATAAALLAGWNLSNTLTDPAASR